MKRKVELMEPARDDLRQIGRYLAIRNQQAAANLLAGLVKQFKLLAKNPYLGRSRDEVLISLRSLVFRNYVIYYLPSDDLIEIWRVLHTSRDAEVIMEGFFDALPR
jgi:toxin ParE1/3/4